MRLPILYGRDIERDFSKEFKYITERIGATGKTWDGCVDSSTADVSENEIMEMDIAKESISYEASDRIIHSMGKSSPEILAAKHGMIDNIVSAVVYPERGNIDRIIDALRLHGMKILPYGGGSSVNGSLKVYDGHHTVSMDMRKFNEVVMGSHFAIVGSGVRGSELEAQLWRSGYTCGNFPESFQYSTVGGWVATGAVGQESNQYGGMENLVLGITLRNSRGWVRDQSVPRQSAGASAKNISLGTAGRPGIITDVIMKTFRLPTRRYYASYFFPTFRDGLRALSKLRRFPTIARLSDETETEFGLDSSEGNLPVQLFRHYLDMRRVGKGAMLIVINNNFQWKEHMENAVFGGSIPAKTWERDRYSRPGLANLLWKAGYVPDTLETSAHWEDLFDLYSDAVKIFRETSQELNFRGEIMAHISHLYESGACIYFTFIISQEYDREVETLKIVRDRLIRTFLRHNGAVTHHHGIGALFKDYVDSGHSQLFSSVSDELIQGI